MNIKLPISIALITYNEELNLARTLSCVSDWADEIIIIDSHSTDKSTEIARSFNSKLYIEDWKGFSNQKNSALAKCTNNWILFLDSDEVVSDELKDNIINAISNPLYNGYYINRKTFYLGKLLNYAWQPDSKLRLVNKIGNPLWKGELIHEALFVEGNTENISGDLIHYSYKNIYHHFIKTIEYAQMSANSYYKIGNNFKISNLLFNPFIAFIRLYIINKGIFDGVRGFIAAMSSMIGTFLKYAFLYELEINNKLKNKLFTKQIEDL